MKKIWDLGEIIAINYLKNKWYQILETNFKFGIIWEIDIVTKLRDLYVFVEVKYRKNDRFWTWEESINFSKRQKIKKTLNYYCLTKHIDLEKARFDVITILWEEINHYESVEL